MEADIEIKNARDVLLYGIWKELEDLNKGLCAIAVCHQGLQITHHNTKMSVFRLAQMLQELKDGNG